MKDLLQQVLPFWDKLSQDDQSLLVEKTTIQKYEKGQFLYYGGGECAGLEIVKLGQIRVLINSPNGGEITLYRLLPGELCILSAACMIKNLDFEIHMEMEGDTEICVIPRSIFKIMMDQNTSVKDFVLELISARFSDIMWLMNQLVFSNMGKRLSQTLLEHSKMTGSNTLHITHAAVARDLGTAREVVTRLLKQFQQDGLVSLSRGNIQILDIERLREFM